MLINDFIFYYEKDSNKFGIPGGVPSALPDRVEGFYRYILKN